MSLTPERPSEIVLQSPPMLPEELVRRHGAADVVPADDARHGRDVVRLHRTRRRRDDLRLRRAVRLRRWAAWSSCRWPAAGRRRRRRSTRSAATTSATCRGCGPRSGTSPTASGRADGRRPARAGRPLGLRRAGPAVGAAADGPGSSRRSAWAPARSGWRRRCKAPQTVPLEDLDPVSSTALRHFIRTYSTVPDLPVAISLRSFAAVTVAGRRPDVLGLTRALLCQLVTSTPRPTCGSRCASRRTGSTTGNGRSGCRTRRRHGATDAVGAAPAGGRLGGRAGRAARRRPRRTPRVQPPRGGRARPAAPDRRRRRRQRPRRAPADRRGRPARRHGHRGRAGAPADVPDRTAAVPAHRAGDSLGMVVGDATEQRLGFLGRPDVLDRGAAEALARHAHPAAHPRRRSSASRRWRRRSGLPGCSASATRATSTRPSRGAARGPRPAADPDRRRPGGPAGGPGPQGVGRGRHGPARPGHRRDRLGQERAAADAGDRRWP